MAITVVSTLPPSSATATADAATADPAIPGDGFADLLLGKLAPAAEGASTAATIAALLKEGAKVSSDPTSDFTQPTDPALLLAAMAAAQPAQSAPQVPVPVESEDGPALSGQIAATGAGNTSSPLAQEKGAAATGKEQATASRLGDTESAPAATSNQSTAKFAVAGQEVDETAAPKAERTGEKTTRGPAADMSSAIANAPAQAHSVQHTRGEAALSVPTAVRDANWNTDFGQKVVWLANSHTQSAELTLNPPDMGSIEISLKVSNDTATATFSSPHSEVREAIETALPRLREMFASAGIELGQTNVSAESFRQATGQGFAENGASHARGDNAILVPDSGGREASGRVAVRQSIGLVDTFV